MKPSVRPLYIFDLDGTLALCEHRRHFLDEPGRSDEKWRRFYAACDKDAPNVPVLETMFGLARAGADVWIFSGRSAEVRDKTLAWLEQHAPLCFQWIQMREEGDHTPDDALKESWLLSMLGDDRKRLVAVFDDRDRVVRMWRRHGVACFQVAPGGF